MDTPLDGELIAESHVGAFAKRKKGQALRFEMESLPLCGVDYIIVRSFARST